MSNPAAIINRTPVLPVTTVPSPLKASTVVITGVSKVVQTEPQGPGFVANACNKVGSAFSWAGRNVQLAATKSWDFLKRISLAAWPKIKSWSIQIGQATKAAAIWVSKTVQSLANTLADYAKKTYVYVRDNWMPHIKTFAAEHKQEILLTLGTAVVAIGAYHIISKLYYNKEVKAHEIAVARPATVTVPGTTVQVPAATTVAV